GWFLRPLTPSIRRQIDVGGSFENCCRITTGTRMEKDYLVLKRASASRTSGQWKEVDFDVLADGVGRRPDHEGGSLAGRYAVALDEMKRREFITLLGGAAAGWPLAASAQQGERVRRVGVLMGWPESDPEARSERGAFVKELQKLGWVDGRNLR